MKRLGTAILLALLSLTLPLARAAQTETPTPNVADCCPPPAVVASFLQFTETQTAQFGTLLGQLKTTVQGLQEQIAPRQAQLDALLSQPNPNPAVVGTLLVQIHALQEQVGQAIQGFQTQFASLLTDEQKQKVQAVALASQLQPVVGAFVALHLAPASTPLPCQKQ